ncbi:hypothetical protein CI238_07331, partial [Colletotrichum incanum]
LRAFKNFSFSLLTAMLLARSCTPNIKFPKLDSLSVCSLAAMQRHLSFAALNGLSLSSNSATSLECFTCKNSIRTTNLTRSNPPALFIASRPRWSDSTLAFSISTSDATLRISCVRDERSSQLCLSERPVPAKCSRAIRPRVEDMRSSLLVLCRPQTLPPRSRLPLRLAQRRKLQRFVRRCLRPYSDLIIQGRFLTFLEIVQFTDRV